MLTIRSIKKRGQRRWQVDALIEGRRARQLFKTKNEAEAQLEALRLQRRDAGDAWLALTPAERNEVMTVWREIQAAGGSLRAIWNHWQDCEHVEHAPSVLLGEAVEMCVQSKAEAGRRPTYVKSLHLMLRRLARGREQLTVNKVTAVDIENWLAENAGTAGSRATLINRVSTLFAFLKRRRLVRDNPCEYLERPSLEQAPPTILTVDQCRQALEWCRGSAPRFLGWLILGLFAGVRPNELDRSSWKDVDLVAGVIRIDAAASKVRQRRIVHLEPAARSWIELALNLKAELPLPHVTRRRYLRALRDQLGFGDWPKDVLRHTAASYWVALKRDTAAVALELGNSAQILLKHYRELVTSEQAEAFWALRPSGS